MKPSLIVASFIVVIALFVPAAIVLPYSGETTPQSTQKQEATQQSMSTQKQQTTQKSKKSKAKSAKTAATEATPLDVSVYRSQAKNVDTMPLEKYVVGVVASEMPAKFKEEALKAQALAARTYIVNFLLSSPDMNLPKKAQVTDTQMNQVYHDKADLKKLWGDDYDWKIKKVKKAVNDTEGQIITYNDKPISPSFFSTSNGYTEDSEDYWEGSSPYLKSVPSPWDRKSPKFKATKKMSVASFDNKLGVKIADKSDVGNVEKTTAGHRIGKIKIGDKSFSGRDVREKLDLRSSDFTIKRKGNQVAITTRGFGHGVGMSQFGANGMASDGKSYQDIIKYYYKGVAISNAQTYTAKISDHQD